MKSAADAEFEVLSTPSGQALLAEIGRNKALTVAQMERLRKAFGPLHFEAAVRLEKARRKGAGKFPESEKLWLDPVRAEQATHQAVAAHKAKRFEGKPVADICCGLGGDTLAIGRVATCVLAIDLDAENLRRLHYNLGQWACQAAVVPVRADANRLPVPNEMLVHIDPDRRSADHAGRPRFQVDQFQPPLAVLLQLMKQHPGGAIKLSPGSDFETLEAAARKNQIKTELEIISLHGECKEATLWFGQLAGPLPRSATALPQDVTFSGTGQNSGVLHVATNTFGKYLMEMESSLVRAGLAQEFAYGQYFSNCSTDNAFFTADGMAELHSPWYSSFEIVEIIKPDRKAVRQALKRLGWPTAVIKTRGRVTAQEALDWLDAPPLGDTLETLFLWTQKQASFAILARRLG